MTDSPAPLRPHRHGPDRPGACREHRRRPRRRARLGRGPVRRRCARGRRAATAGTATDASDEFFAAGDVDAVLIASPTPTHVDLIAAAVDAGIPVLCEKPIDLDIARVDALRPKVAASGVPVALGFNRRFDPAFAEVRARVAAGEIGALEQLSIVSRDPAAPPACLHRGLRRHLPRHDDPRLRHGPILRPRHRRGERGRERPRSTRARASTATSTPRS